MFVRSITGFYVCYNINFEINNKSNFRKVNLIFFFNINTLLIREASCIESFRCGYIKKKKRHRRHNGPIKLVFVQDQELNILPLY